MAEMASRQEQLKCSLLARILCHSTPYRLFPILPGRPVLAVTPEHASAGLRRSEHDGAQHSVIIPTPDAPTTGVASHNRQTNKNVVAA